MAIIRPVATTPSIAQASPSEARTSLEASWRAFLSNARPETVSAWAVRTHGDLLQRFAPDASSIGRTGTSEGANLGAGPLVLAPNERMTKQR